MFFEKYSYFDLGRHFNDLTKTWWIVLATGFFSIIASLTYLSMLKHAAKSILYMSLVLTLCLMFGGGFYLYTLAELRYAEEDSNRTLLRAFAGILWGFTALLLIFTLCCWR